MSNETAPVSSDATHAHLDASNVLVLAPSITSLSTDVCTDLLSRSHAGEVSVLRLEFIRSPNGLLARWPRDAGSVPSELKIISVGPGPRADEERIERAEQLPHDVAVDVENVGNAGNLTDMGVEITRALEEWSGSRTVFCFHSLTPLLLYAEFERAYRFLHVVTRHVSRQDVLAHYHMDPSAHDPDRVNTLKTLFAAVIEVDDDGERKVLTY